MSLVQTTILDSFGKGGANIGDGTPVISEVLQEIQSNLAVLDSGQADAVASAVSASASAAAVAAANTGIVKRTVAITQASDLAGLGAGVKSFSKNVGAVLPANARFVGVDLKVTSALSGGSVATGTVAVGVTGTANALVTATSVTSATGFPKAGTAGVKGYSMSSLDGLQLTVTVTTDVDLNALTGGSVSVDVFYVVLP